MKESLRSALTITFACWLATFISNSTFGRNPYQAYTPKVGELHPNFVLRDIESGRDIQLSDYRGKKVLLLHFASW